VLVGYEECATGGECCDDDGEDTLVEASEESGFVDDLGWAMGVEAGVGGRLHARF